MPFDGQTYIKPDTHLADILRAAWKDIERNGWAKYGKHCNFGPSSHCAVEATSAVCREHHDAHLANRMLERALPAGFEIIGTYNDHPDTTLADMRALFFRAIDLVGG